MSRDDAFLSRWSARKLKARDEPEAGSKLAQPPGPSEPVAVEPGPEKTDEEILAELGLPDPETLVKGDDFKAFLKAGVPARLRNRALRRLWVSDPVLACVDGLNDYDGDFTDAATVVKDLKTAYRVGRGMLRDNPPADAEPADGAALAEAGGVAPEEAPDAAADGERRGHAGDAEVPVRTQGEPAGEPGAPAGEVTDGVGSGGTGAEPDPDQTAEAGAGQPMPRAARMRFSFDRG